MVAGLIFSGLLFLGLYAFNFRISPPEEYALKGIKNRAGQSGMGTAVSGNATELEPLITTPLPSQEELLRQMVGARSHAHEAGPSREPEIWEKQVQTIQDLAVAPAEKVRRLMELAPSLPEERQAFVYSSACALAPSSLYQGKLYPLVWNSHTPGSVARAVAAGVITEPDGFKLPALLALLKHPDVETQAMAYNVLWAYFPYEPASNYPQAVQRFLSGTY